MVSRTDAESFKNTAPFMIEFYPQGAVAAVVEGDVFAWVANSKNIGVEVFRPGEKIKAEGVAGKAMASRQMITDRIPAAVYGIRMYITAVPIQEDQAIVGALVLGIPQVSPVESAFDALSPIMSQIFPEGAMTYITDTEKFTHRYGDEKFDLPAVAKGAKFASTGVAAKTIKEKRSTVMELDASVYGEVCLVGNFPLFDGDEVIGTFGISTPKRTAVKLRDMAVNLHEGMGQIAAAIEELAASSFEINAAEQNLNKDVQEVATLSNDINNILGFIKQIAEETKMLGLNAAIEAARAGEAGRGFGVVAEEIRKLSDESKGTVAQIRELTEQINVKIALTIRNSNTTLHSSEEQAAATEQITAQVEEMNGIAEELDRVARSV